RLPHVHPSQSRHLTRRNLERPEAFDSDFSCFSLNGGDPRERGLELEGSARGRLREGEKELVSSLRWRRDEECDLPSALFRTLERCPGDARELVALGELHNDLRQIALDHIELD